MHEGSNLSNLKVANLLFTSNSLPARVLIFTSPYMIFDSFITRCFASAFYPLCSFIGKNLPDTRVRVSSFSLKVVYPERKFASSRLKLAQPMLKAES